MPYFLESMVVFVWISSFDIYEDGFGGSRGKEHGEFGWDMG
jgi:hypothetical protein